MGRIKLVIPKKKIFSTEIPVRITDINYGSHVGNDALVSILHEARMQWLVSLNYTELNIENASLIMADLAVEYKAESFYGDVFIIDIYIGEISKVSFEIYYSIHTCRKAVNIIIAKAKTGMVCFDYNAKKVADIPEKFFQIIKS